MVAAGSAPKASINGARQTTATGLPVTGSRRLDPVSTSAGTRQTANPTRMHNSPVKTSCGAKLRRVKAALIHPPATKQATQSPQAGKACTAADAGRNSIAKLTATPASAPDAA